MVQQLEKPGSTVDELLSVLRSRSAWGGARDHFVKLAECRRSVVDLNVSEFTKTFQGNRAAMIVDVVLSCQRDYKKFVYPAVEMWMAVHPAMTLADLATAQSADLKSEIPRLRIDKKANEPATILGVATGLNRYCQENSLDDDTGVKTWAQSVEPLRYVSKMDDYVGRNEGIGIALFAYMRMRAGVDAIKPDTRVKAALEDSGLGFPKDNPQAYLLMAEGMAAGLRMCLPWFAKLEAPRLWFDQLLWLVAPVKASPKT